MSNATQTVSQARSLRTALKAAGHSVNLHEAWALVRAGQQAARETRDELAHQARVDRQRRGDVARHCQDLRACGAWDGE
ncbi:MAG: hypothetical protein V3U11_00620 [Planctomycetota bacterium]